MDIIRNNYSGITHMALSMSDQTLCGIHKLENKLDRLWIDGVQVHGSEPPDYEVLMWGALLVKALEITDCKRCRAYVEHHYHLTPEN